MDNPFLFHTFIDLAEKTLSQLSSPFAVFDADGTLWKEDIGFGFFYYQIENKWIEDESLKKKVNDLYNESPQNSCSLIVQLNKNIHIKQYRKWCKEYLKTNPVTVFSFQKKLISFLHNKGVKNYVVTASPEWLVEEAIKHYELPIDKVIGFKTLIKNELITDQLQYPLPIGSGKMSAYLQKSNSIYPFFSSGNTLSDLDLLELASHFKLVVTSASKNEKHFDSERILLSIARQKSWFYKDLS